MKRYLRLLAEAQHDMDKAVCWTAWHAAHARAKVAADAIARRTA